MIVCNDYLQLTKRYLRSFELYKQTAESLALAIEDNEKALATESLKAVSYGEKVSGSAGELTTTERAVERRMKIEQLTGDLRVQHERLATQVRRIQLALKAVTPDELEIIRLVYFERLAYKQVCLKVNLSERSCKRRVHEATRKVAVLLFGLQAEEQVFFLGIG